MALVVVVVTVFLSNVGKSPDLLWTGQEGSCPFSTGHRDTTLKVCGTLEAVFWLFTFYFFYYLGDEIVIYSTNFRIPSHVVCRTLFLTLF